MYEWQKQIQIIVDEIDECISRQNDTVHIWGNKQMQAGKTVNTVFPAYNIWY